MCKKYYTLSADDTGLGFYICHEIIAKHKGSINLESSESGGAKEFQYMDQIIVKIYARKV